MARIKAPNKEYTGISASVYFVNGVGNTDNENLIEWFRDRGYEVDEDSEEKEEKEEKEIDGLEKTEEIGKDEKEVEKAKKPKK